MAATKMRSKKPTKSKTPAAKKAPARKTAMKARATKKPAAAAKKTKVKQPPVRKDETTVRNGPHHVERHPTEGGIHVHPAPLSHVQPKRLPVVVRHH